MLAELRPKILDNRTNDETEEFKQMTLYMQGKIKRALMELEAIKRVANDSRNSDRTSVDFTKEYVKEIVQKTEDLLKGALLKSLVRHPGTHIRECTALECVWT